MSKKDILYLSVNDGSDTRINKEVKSLSELYNVHFVGIGASEDKSFVKPYCATFSLCNGSYKSKRVLVKFLFQTLFVFIKRRFHSVHVINEPLLLLSSPLLIWHKHVVLDIFDSKFLKLSSRGWVSRFFKRLSYRIPKFIIVTDDNRKQLMPDAIKEKVVVLENFPYKRKEIKQSLCNNGDLSIFYGGTLNAMRGTSILKKMLEEKRDLKVRVAGWVTDEETSQFVMMKNVEFQGVVTQEDAATLASSCDYILSVYEPCNENNVNASPNKIYDAFQVRTPVITNEEIVVAPFVRDNNIGYVLDDFYNIDYPKFISALIARRGQYEFNSSLRENCIWSKVEHQLINVHKG